MWKWHFQSFKYSAIRGFMSEPHSFRQQKSQEGNISKDLFSKSFFPVPFFPDEELPLETGNISAPGSPGCFCLQVSDSSAHGFRRNLSLVYPRCFSAPCVSLSGFSSAIWTVWPTETFSGDSNTGGHLPQVMESSFFVSLWPPCPWGYCLPDSLL